MTIAAPQRQWTLANPLAVHIVEWGPADGPPLVLVHGGGDFARSFDGFAPLLAERGWRVVAWDQRGHGDSARAELYAWQCELRDLLAVLRAVASGDPAGTVGGDPAGTAGTAARRVPVIGHSKGGVLSIEAAVARPELFAAVVSIDGFVRRIFPPRPPQDTAERWLDLQQGGRTPKAQTFDELVAARQAANPRLERAWIEHLVTTGAAPQRDGRWAWKIDPAAFPLPPHAMPMEVSVQRVAALRCPLLALKAAVMEPIAGSLTVEELRPHLPADARLEILDGLGHFAHIEDPARVAALTLDFLAEVVSDAPGH